MVVYLAVADDVFNGVLFCAVLFPMRCLDEIWDRIESVPEDFFSLLLLLKFTYMILLIFVYLLLLKNLTFRSLFNLTKGGVKCRVAAVRRIPCFISGHIINSGRLEPLGSLSVT